MTTLAIARRRNRQKKAIGMPGNNDRILAVARRLRHAVSAPVLGGIAVFLHGGGRSTVDLDLYTTDRAVTAAQLVALGARWDAAKREHILDDVRIHTVSPEEARVTITKTSIIDGVHVISLKDLIAIKLTSGLNNPGRSKDLGDVEDLIRAIHLDKRFAASLPNKIRGEFKALVDAVRAGERLGRF